jgi:hypothetical protein
MAPGMSHLEASESAERSFLGCKFQSVAGPATGARAIRRLPKPLRCYLGSRQIIRIPRGPDRRDGRALDGVVGLQRKVSGQSHGRRFMSGLMEPSEVKARNNRGKRGNLGHSAMVSVCCDYSQPARQRLPVRCDHDSFGTGEIAWAQ